MKQNTKFISFGVLVALIIMASAYFIVIGTGNGVAANNDSAVVAVVDGREITRGDVRRVAENLPGAERVPIEQLYPMVVEQLINDILLEKAVEESQIANDPEVQQRLDEMRVQIASSIYLERHIEEKITEARIREEYDRLKQENEGVEEIRARHILVESESEARRLIEQLDGGADFRALAREHSTDSLAESGGDLGYFTQGTMVPEFSDAAFATAPGNYTPEPVQTQFGWHIIYVESMRERPIPSFEEIKPMIRNQLNQRAVEELVDNLREGVEIQKFTWDGEPLTAN